jgi:hypothetical protein
LVAAVMCNDTRRANSSIVWSSAHTSGGTCQKPTGLALQESATAGDPHSFGFPETMPGRTRQTMLGP